MIRIKNEDTIVLSNDDAHVLVGFLHGLGIGARYSSWNGETATLQIRNTYCDEVKIHDPSATTTYKKIADMAKDDLQRFNKT